MRQLKQRRKIRTRSKIRGTDQRPRLSVFPSHRQIYAQLIDDEKALTLVAASSRHLDKKNQRETKVKKARLVGQSLAQKAIKKGIKKAIFDRGHFKYHGRVRALAEGAREGGLEF